MLRFRLERGLPGTNHRRPHPAPRTLIGLPLSSLAEAVCFGLPHEGHKPWEETEPVNATVDQADIRGLVTTSVPFFLTKSAFILPSAASGRNQMPDNFFAGCKEVTVEESIPTDRLQRTGALARR